MCSQLKTAKKVCGIKQAKKAVKTGVAKTVYVAQDCDPKLVDPLLEHCRHISIPIVEVNTMEELGNLCELDVGCAIAVICE